MPLSACSLNDINLMYPMLPSALNLTACTVITALFNVTSMGSSSPILTTFIVNDLPTGPRKSSTASLSVNPSTSISSICVI